MNRRVTGFCVAATIGFSVSLAAQDPASATGAQRDSRGMREVTVSGCVARGAGDTFILTNARIEPPSSMSSTSSTTSTTTSTGTTAGTTGATTTAGTAGATTTTPPTAPAGSGSMAGANPMSTWSLSGSTEFDKHVGHRVQITGRTSADPSMSRPSTSTGATTAGATTAGATATAGATTPGATTTADSNQPKLEVQSIKMIAATCS